MDGKIKYQRGKETARNKAFQWVCDFADNNYTYSELADFSAYFTKLGKRYGLLKEFRENAII